MIKLHAVMMLISVTVLALMWCLVFNVTCHSRLKSSTELMLLVLYMYILPTLNKYYLT